MEINGWTENLPKKSGKYYFYGDFYSKKNDKNFNAELHFVTVISNSDDVFYSTSNGEFFFPENNSNWYGKFKLIDIELPEL